MDNAPKPDIDAIKARMKATWTAGDFGKIAEHSEVGAARFIERRNIKSGMRVLDVACGSGNLALPAARAGGKVVGVDIAPNLLEEARERARREGLEIQFDEGDAEDLPYDDAAFDLVVTMFGAMFAPRPERAAAELIRVCRPGGQIAMANWTPRGFAGEMFRTTAKHVPMPPGILPPTLWGDEATVRDRLKDGIAKLSMSPVMAPLKYPFSPAETVAFFRTYFGPVKIAFEAMPDEKRPAFLDDLTDLFTRHNKATDGTTHIDGEYLEVVATRAG